MLIAHALIIFFAYGKVSFGLISTTIKVSIRKKRA
jgi:hypothetical protein